MQAAMKGGTGNFLCAQRCKMWRQLLNIEKIDSSRPEDGLLRNKSANFDAFVSQWNMLSPENNPPASTPYSPPTN